MATNLGFSVILAEDATASFPLHDHNGRMFSAQEIQDSTLASLNEEFATILSPQQILDSL